MFKILIRRTAPTETVDHGGGSTRHELTRVKIRMRMGLDQVRILGRVKKLKNL